jgi:hypothetical protein
MKVIILVYCLLGVVSCIKSNEVKRDREISIEFAGPIQAQRDLVKATYGKGGQPGEIYVTGVPINEDSDKNKKLDTRISARLEPGKNKEGIQEKLTEGLHQYPKLELLVSEKIIGELELATKSNNLINLGCETTRAETLAKERNLSIVEAPNVDETGSLNIAANTILFCGEYSKPGEYNFLELTANELIMNDLNYQHSQFLGATIIHANKLVLQGKNSIHAKAFDNDKAVPIAPWISIVVAKEFIFDETGSFELATFGSNFAEVKKDNK